MIENWKLYCKWSNQGYFTLQTEDTGSVEVRLFLTAELLMDAEVTLYTQIVNATRFPGVKMVSAFMPARSRRSCRWPR